MTEEVRQSGPGTRLRVLGSLRSSTEPAGVQQLAERTGLHPNTVRFHLDRLQRDGLVEREVQHSGDPGRPRLAFTPASVPDSGGSYRDFGELAAVLVKLAEVTDEPAALSREAGRRWGHSLAAEEVAGPLPVQDLVTLLLRLGFAPQLEPQGADGTLTLVQSHCPFLELAQDSPEVVCSVHHGLLEGFLEARAAPVAARGLVPFAGPGGCEAYLAAENQPGPGA